MLKPTSLYLDTADMKQLKRLADKEGLKMADLVRKAIKEFIRRAEESKQS